MPKTVFTGSHKILIDALIEARKKAGLSQVDLGNRIGRNQKFISLIESSQRRIDVIEFCYYSRAMGRDPLEILEGILKQLPDSNEI